MFKYLKAIFKGVYKLLFAYPKICKYARNKDKYPLEERYAFVRKLVKIIIKCFDVEVVSKDLDKIDVNEPFLFVCNHQGFMDSLSLIYLSEKPIIFVTKKEARKYFFAGKIIYMIDAIFLDRDNVKESVKMLRTCKEHLNEGKIVGIFPEGTRTRDENYNMGSYKAGALKSAYDSKKKIVAIAIDGSYKILSTKYKGKTQVKVNLVDIVEPRVYEEKNTNQIALELENKTKEKLKEMRKH